MTAYVEQFSDPDLARGLLREIEQTATRPWAIMEVCGGQTHAIIRNGIDQLLPESVELIHGPGCPVCVTPLEIIDRALEIAARPDVIFCSFGDMLRVPGSDGDLFQVRAEGGDVELECDVEQDAIGLLFDLYAEQKVVDLVRIDSLREASGAYEGICW